MKATILSNREFIPLYYHLVLAYPAQVRFEPGQFAMIGFGVLDPFLPRAFSLYKAGGQQPATGGRRRGKKGRTAYAATETEDRGITRVEFLYKVMGRGSAYLSTLKRGQTLEMLAPLGRGFTVPEGLKTAILVAGGIGVPPIVALAEWIARNAGGRRPVTGGQIKLVAFVGGKSKEDVLCVQDFKRAGAEVHPVTEDGSMGRKGLVTDVVAQYLQTTGPRPPTAIYACGPKAMLAAVAGVAARYDLPCQVSMEAPMACGFGICMGCAIPVRPQTPDPRPQTPLYKLCCKDGPVFDAGEIAWS